MAGCSCPPAASACSPPLHARQPDLSELEHTLTCTPSLCTATSPPPPPLAAEPALTPAAASRRAPARRHQSRSSPPSKPGAVPWCYPRALALPELRAACSLGAAHSSARDAPKPHPPTCSCAVPELRPRVRSSAAPLWRRSPSACCGTRTPPAPAARLRPSACATQRSSRLGPLAQRPRGGARAPPLWRRLRSAPGRTPPAPPAGPGLQSSTGAVPCSRRGRKARGKGVPPVGKRKAPGRG
jgi:hypothetical protein